MVAVIQRLLDVLPHTLPILVVLIIVIIFKLVTPARVILAHGVQIVNMGSKDV